MLYSYSGSGVVNVRVRYESVRGGGVVSVCYGVVALRVYSYLILESLMYESSLIVLYSSSYSGVVNRVVFFILLLILILELLG